MGSIGPRVCEVPRQRRPFGKGIWASEASRKHAVVRKNRSFRFFMLLLGTS